MAKKKGIKILLVLIVILVAAAVGKDFILKSVITVAASKITGAKVTMRGFALRVLKQSVTITEFKMYNPAGFPQGVMIDLPKVHVALDVPALLKGQLHIPKAELALKEVVIVKNKDGALNVQSLAVSQQKEGPAKKKEQPVPEKRPSKAMPLRIDELSLDIGKIVQKDYSGSDEPVIKVTEVNFKKVYRDIGSAQELVLLILSESLRQSAFKGAALYGATAIAGAAVLPVGVTAVLVGKDSSAAEFPVSAEKAFAMSKEVLAAMGQVTMEDSGTGVLKARVQGCDVALKVVAQQAGGVQVTVSARKLLIPKPEIAGGVLHEITQKLQP